MTYKVFIIKISKLIFFLFVEIEENVRFLILICLAQPSELDSFDNKLIIPLVHVFI